MRPVTGGLAPWGALALLLLAALALFHRPLGQLLRLAGALRPGAGGSGPVQPGEPPDRRQPGGQPGQRPGSGGAGGPRLRAAADAPVGAAVSRGGTEAGPYGGVLNEAGRWDGFSLRHGFAVTPPSKREAFRGCIPQRPPLRGGSQRSRVGEEYKLQPRPAPRNTVGEGLAPPAQAGSSPRPGPAQRPAPTVVHWTERGGGTGSPSASLRSAPPSKREAFRGCPPQRPPLRGGSQRSRVGENTSYSPAPPHAIP